MSFVIGEQTHSGWWVQNRNLHIFPFFLVLNTPFFQTNMLSKCYEYNATGSTLHELIWSRLYKCIVISTQGQSKLFPWKLSVWRGTFMKCTDYFFCSKDDVYENCLQGYLLNWIGPSHLKHPKWIYIFFKNLSTIPTYYSTQTLVLINNKWCKLIIYQSWHHHHDIDWHVGWDLL